MKGRKYVIDTLEDKTNETQEKISSLRKWNCTELGMLEAKEVNLEASLIEVKSKNEELKARAEEKVQQITNIKGILIYLLPCCSSLFNKVQKVTNKCIEKISPLSRVSFFRYNLNPIAATGA
jgi:hypothetical protein